MKCYNLSNISNLKSPNNSHICNCRKVNEDLKLHWKIERRPQCTVINTPIISKFLKEFTTNKKKSYKVVVFMQDLPQNSLTREPQIWFFNDQNKLFFSKFSIWHQHSPLWVINERKPAHLFKFPPECHWNLVTRLAP